MIKRKFFIKVLRTSIATALLIFALTFITNAVTSWNASPSVTTGTYFKIHIMYFKTSKNYAQLLENSQLTLMEEWRG